MLLDVTSEDHLIEAAVCGDREPASQVAVPPRAEDEKRDPRWGREDKAQAHGELSVRVRRMESEAFGDKART